MKKELLSIVIIYSFLLIVAANAQNSKLEKAKQLGETARRMVCVSSTGTFTGVNYADETTYSAEFDRFGELLKAGADPNLIRISGFVPTEVSDGSAGMKKGQPFIAMLDDNKVIVPGKLGEVVPAKKGGMTLLKYLQANDLQDACELLKKYTRVKKAPSKK
jgi:hypothetical protein